MQGACKHARSQMIARRDGVDTVRCLECGQVLEAEAEVFNRVPVVTTPGTVSPGKRNCVVESNVPTV